MARICLWALFLFLLTGCSMDELRRSSARTRPLPEAPRQKPSDILMEEADLLADSEREDETDSDDFLRDPLESASLDAETLEDLALLKGADQAAPDEEGETVKEAGVRFDLPMVENAKVRHYVNYYSGPGRAGFRRWLERSGRYLPMMREIFAEEEVPLDLTYLAMIESGFNPRAYSHANAVGPWQFMAATGKVYGLNNDWWRDERRDFLKSTRAAARHLKDLHQRFEGDWYLAAAAYNAGGGRVSRAISAAGSRDFWEICRGGHLPEETRNYLPKLLAVLLIAKEPAAYGFDDLNYQKPLTFDIVTLPSNTDLALVARLCGVSYDEIVVLNPELKRWCTPPGVNRYPIRLPSGAAASFQKKYAQVPAERRANFRRHRIASGDTLSGLAKRYGIQSKDIVALNAISNPRALRIGRDLILPLRPGVTLPPERMGADHERPRQQNYRVRNGDSLWTIGRRFNVSTRQLCAWNGINDKTILKPGKVLRVAGGAVASSGGQQKLVYQVRPGDTLWGIGRRYDLKTADIMRWNRLSNSHVLRPGDRLTLLLSQGRQG